MSTGYGTTTLAVLALLLLPLPVTPLLLVGAWLVLGF